MFGLRWRTLIAAFSVSMLGASIVYEAPRLLAKDKDQPSNSTSSQGKTTKKKDKRSTNATGQGGSNGGSSSGGGYVNESNSVGGGGVVGGFGGGNGSGSSNSGSGSSGNTSNQSTSNSRTSNPPGIGGPTGSKQAKSKSGSSRSSLNSKGSALTAAHPLVKRVIDVQNRNQKSWLSQRGVVGAATGLDADNNVVIRVYVTGADKPVIPTQIEGVAITKVLTGPLRFAQSPNLPPTPTPIGNSTFIDTQGQSAVACQGSNGTIACRMVDSNSNIYALSCNHVFAGNQLVIASFDQATQTNTDQTVIFFAAGTNALQPAGTIVGCKTPSNQYSNILGTLSAVTPFYAYYIDPGTMLPQYTSSDPHVDSAGNPTNLTDSALVLTTASTLDTATPPDGYGIPTNNYVPASLGMNVQKFGTVTRLTTGSVTGLNATYTIQVDISTANVLIKQSATQSITNGTVTYVYTAGFAGTVSVPFSSQIEISPTGGFSAFAQQGDSGALVVDMSRNPTGLVQALGTSPIVFCGDWNNVLIDLAKAIATATGNQVALNIDTSPSSLQQSQDGKVGRASPNKP